MTSIIWPVLQVWVKLHIHFICWYFRWTQPHYFSMIHYILHVNDDGLHITHHRHHHNHQSSLPSSFINIIIMNDSYLWLSSSSLSVGSIINLLLLLLSSSWYCYPFFISCIISINKLLKNLKKKKIRLFFLYFIYHFLNGMLYIIF